MLAEEHCDLTLGCVCHSHAAALHLRVSFSYISKIPYVGFLIAWCLHTLFLLEVPTANASFLNSHFLSEENSIYGRLPEKTGC